MFTKEQLIASVGLVAIVAMVVVPVVAAMVRPAQVEAGYGEDPCRVPRGCKYVSAHLANGVLITTYNCPRYRLVTRVAARGDVPYCAGSTRVR